MILGLAGQLDALKKKLAEKEALLEKEENRLKTERNLQQKYKTLVWSSDTYRTMVIALGENLLECCAIANEHGFRLITEGVEERVDVYLEGYQDDVEPAIGEVNGVIDILLNVLQQNDDQISEENSSINTSNDENDENDDILLPDQLSTETSSDHLSSCSSFSVSWQQIDSKAFLYEMPPVFVNELFLSYIMSKIQIPEEFRYFLEQFLDDLVHGNQLNKNVPQELLVAFLKRWNKDLFREHGDNWNQFGGTIHAVMFRVRNSPRYISMAIVNKRIIATQIGKTKETAIETLQNFMVMDPPCDEFFQVDPEPIFACLDIAPYTQNLLDFQNKSVINVHRRLIQCMINNFPCLQQRMLSNTFRAIVAIFDLHVEVCFKYFKKFS